MSVNTAIQDAMSEAEVVTLWPEPQPLPQGLQPVLPFDLAMLPASLAPWVSDIAERMQAPIEYVAVTAIVAAGAVIGRKVGIRPQEHTDWYEVPNLWGLIVGRPGVMKSPSTQQALKPINRLQASARDDHEAAKSAFVAGEMERELRAEARKKAMRERLKGNPGADTSDLAMDDTEEPTLRRYVANDTSYQSLGELLRQNPNGMLVYRDEMLSLLRSLDREDNVEARGFYLTAWNGTDGYTFDRIGRGFDLHIPSVNVSMIGSTQPGRLRDYISGAVRGGGADDGLIQRFSLMVWPDVAKSYVEQDREPDPVARSAAFAVFERLDQLTAATAGATIDQFDPDRPYLRFDQEGLAMFQTWRLELEQRLRGGTLHPAMESHVAKYRKLVPTLALIHHLASGNTGPVAGDSVLAALCWAEFLESHAHRAYAAALDTSTDGAREILRHIRGGDLPSPFTARDVLRRAWSGLSDRERVADAIETLEEHGWLRAEPVPAGAKGGRPTVAYTGHPKASAR
jgi:hypothetical protein